MNTEADLEEADAPPPRRGPQFGTLAAVGAAVIALVAVVGLAMLIARAGGDSGSAPPAVDAEALVAATNANLERYTDIEAAKADGYVPISAALDETTPGYLHLVDPDRVADPSVADPEEVESLLYSRGDDGELHLLAAMYILPPDQTLDDAPEVSDPAAHWHEHSDLCWLEDRPGLIAGPYIDGECAGGGVHRALAMLHVWIVDNECGRFADLVGHGSESEVCNHEHLPEAFEGMVS